VSVNRSTVKVILVISHKLLFTCLTGRDCS